MIKFTIPLTPVTKKNSSRIIRRRGRQYVIPSEAFEKCQDEAGWFIPHKGERISVPVEVSCSFYMPTRGKVDLANLLNAICDVLVHYGVLADDNSDIIVSHDRSRVIKGAKKPRTEVRIRPCQDTIPDLEKLIERVLISANPTPELFELISAIQEAL